ncbi:MAG TPA: enoyl-CoA hydratase-related protein [Vineibacter sp.]|nr:enoyl-CoA hydratase-related protein [Vineibacter sp.]
MLDVKYERRGVALWIVIDREERRNALNEDVARGIADGIRLAQEDRSIRAVVLTGAGERVFCAGGDVKPDAEGNPFDADPAQPRNPVVELFKEMERCDVPIVARVNGHAYGGGFGLVCACDLAVATEDAKLGTPEARIGLFPMMILPYMLRVVPRRALLEMCVTGEPWTAAEAKALGIVNHVAPAAELDDKLDWLLARFTDNSPTAVRLGKHALHAIQDMTLPQSLDFAQNFLAQMARTEDAREGFRAFNERRTPDWPGR